MNKKKKRKKRVAKKKLTVSSEYNEGEIEVRELLEKEGAKVKTENDDIEEEIQFFTGSPGKSDQPEKTSPSKSSDTAEKSEAEATHLASSYVQIEDESPVTWVEGHPISLENDLLFFPSKTENTDTHIDDYAQRITEKEGLFSEAFAVGCGKNHNQMVDRLCKQGSSDLISKGFLKQHTFEIDKNLYKTVSDKEFVPIYCNTKLTHKTEPPPELDKALKIVLKQLRFSDHSLFTQENKLAVQLENLCSIYQEKQSMNMAMKLSSELDAVRSIVGSILQESTTKNSEELEAYVHKTKMLRESLHQEEKAIKKLAESVLSTWKNLKEVRARQNYNHTTVKLSIIVEEPADLAKAEQEYNDRFNIELDELLREAYEGYYRKKRIKKSQKKDNKSINLSPLRKPDVEEIREELQRVFNENLASPSDPRLSFQIDHISRSEDIAADKIRKYYLKIFLDNHQVGVTRNYRQSGDFIVDLNEMYTVLLKKRVPEHIKIEVYEKGKLSPDIRICDLHLPLAKAQAMQNEVELLQFSNHKQKISGTFQVALSYEPKTSDLDRTDYIELAPIKSKSKVSKDVLQHWYENQLVDPLDPDCISIFNMINEKNEDLIEDPEEDGEYFTLNEDKYAFCSEEEIKNNARLNMLTARFNSDMKYKDLTLVPIFDRELEDKSEKTIIDQSDWQDPIHLQRHQGRKYLKELYETVANLCDQMSKNQKSFNLLIGDEPPTLSSIISSIMQMFGPSRPLNPPKSSVVSRISMPTNAFYSFNVVVNVIRATGVPVRDAVATPRRGSSASMSHQALKYANVRPYISVNYQDKSTRTVSVDGSNPTWNEQLIIQISGKLNELKGDIKFQLFDEYVEDLINDDRSRVTEVYQRIYGKWLGEFRLPMSTIIARHKIEGVFELETPKVLLGYTRPSLESSEGSVSIENVPEIRDVVYLSLLISLEPQFDLIKSSTEYLESSELKEVKAHVYDWSLEIRTNFPDRFIDPFITISNGKRVCMTRLLEPVPVPFETNDFSEGLIRRYISLFPVFRSINSGNGLNGVWLSNQLVLDTSWGSSKDLGVLLACFYMSLGTKVWLILGTGYPYGDSTFVLLEENGGFLVVDPSTGRKYSSKDIFCPLLKVRYIVDQNNIYANIQSEERVSMTNFNVNDSSCWMSLFNKSNPAPVGGIHELNYKYRGLHNVNDLRRTIERKIIKKINSWRYNRKTVWNRALHDILNGILMELEQDVVLDRCGDDYLDRIAQALPAFKVSGFTLNMPYINLSSISDRIKGTGIHLNSDKRVEFSVAVYVRQYANNILSEIKFLRVFATNSTTTTTLDPPTMSGSTEEPYTAGKTSVILVTTPDENVAKQIAHALVTRKLAACVNIVPQITSIYDWEGKINEDQESLLVIKSRTTRVDELTAYVRDNHPYSVAEVISLPIEKGNEPYLQWVLRTVPEKS